MDFSTLFSGGSAIAAIVSVFFAIVSWYQSLGSKKAKDKAEEAHRAALEMRDAAVRAAKAAEERARQMERIVAEQQKQSEIHWWCGYLRFNWSSNLRNLSSLFFSASSSSSGERGRRSPRMVNSLTSILES